MYILQLNALSYSMFSTWMDICEYSNTNVLGELCTVNIFFFIPRKFVKYPDISMLLNIHQQLVSTVEFVQFLYYFRICHFIFS